MTITHFRGGIMGTFKRLTTSIVASFESVVGQIENHEALVSSAIKEVDESAARARAQLNRVRSDGQLMRRKLADVRSQQDLWKDRAKKTAALDEAKAIECLKRYKRCQDQIMTLEAQEREHTKTERQLLVDLETLEEKVRTLRQQRNLLRTRQSRAEALKLLQQVDSQAISEIDDIFTRWEAKVLACESGGSCSLSSDDPLEDEFSTEEEQHALKELLLEITNEKSDNAKSA